MESTIISPLKGSDSLIEIPLHSSKMFKESPKGLSSPN